MNWRIVIGFLLIFATNNVFSQHHYFKQFSTNEGLDGLNIEAIYQSNDGYLWIASHMGLAKFDGNTFTNYDISQGLPDSRILSITGDLQGNIWMGTINSLVKFNGEKFVKFNPYKEANFNFIRQMCTDYDGNVWMAASGGICKLNSDQSDTVNLFTYFPVSEDRKKNMATGIAVGADNVVWATTNSGLYKISNDSIFLETKNSGNFVLEDNDHNVWMTTWGSGAGGLRMWDGDSLHLFGELIHSPPTSLQIDNEGNIWVATFGKGIFKISKVNGKYQAFQFTEKEGYPSKTNWGMTKDMEGNIWVGSFGKGLFRYSGDLVTYIDKTDGLIDNVINDVQFDLNGKVWISSTEGINHYGNNYRFYSKNTKITTITEIENPPIYSLDSLKKYNPEEIDRFFLHKKPVHEFISNGNIILNPRTGEVVIPTNSKYTAIFTNEKPSILPIGSGQSGVLDSKNNLWLGSDGSGIYKFDGKKIHTFSYTNERNYNRIFSVFADKNDRIWGGAYSGGIDLIENDSLYRFDFGGRFQSTSIAILGETPDHRIWFSPERGILYAGILNDDHDFKLVDSLTVERGLASNIILDIECSSDGFLWIATSKGLDKLDYTYYTEKGKVNITHFDKKDGFPTAFISGITIDPKKNLWLSTNEGLCFFNRGKEHSQSYNPIVHIIKAELFLGQENINQYGDLNGKTNLPSNLELPYSMNHLTFSFIGIHLSNPESVKYRYRLRGFDKDWQPITKDNKITYSNLPFGEFIFEVSASCKNSKWSESVHYQFKIAAPFWKETWFIFLVITSLVAIIVFYIRVKTVKLRKNNEILETKVIKRTNELNSAYLELSEKNQEIVDSIVYAKRIQNAILPPLRIVKEYLKDSFILYKPKDVVAGDFYWMHQADNKILFAAADCTGHGVPGAMVSVICNNALNRAVREYNLTNPGEILDKTREIVIEEFEKSDEEVKDGMDIALCGLSYSSALEGRMREVTLQYAGANNPLWIIRDNEILETKANKQPIGKFDKPTPYTTHSFDLQKGDIIYLFSDGYIDQFGGDKGKKLKAKAFRTLLLSIRKESMDQQKIIIDKTFENWRGDLEQIDDVCIIGVRV